MSKHGRITLFSVLLLVCISSRASTVTHHPDSVFTSGPVAAIVQTPGSTPLPDNGDTSTPDSPYMASSTPGPAHSQATPVRTLASPTAAIVLGCILLGLAGYTYFRRFRDLS
ncbi:MAG: hypothetical protein OEY45_02130 [Gammaproteobacteria bacterium]|nr:hypothetical protein [Gammaproteobacteria bacterium]